MRKIIVPRQMPVTFFTAGISSIEPARYWEMAPIEEVPNFYRYSPDIEYGAVHIAGTDYTVILGPAFSVPVTQELIRIYMHENAISMEHQEAITESLCSIPRITYQQFSRHLALLHISLNQKEISLPELYHQDDVHIRKREEQNLNEIMNNFENNNLHDSYYFKQELYQCIKEGNLIKPEEAKGLLTYSNKSLIEISNYLCFSSQSYFQNVFKKKYGITPLQYRKTQHVQNKLYKKYLCEKPVSLNGIQA